VIVWPNRVLITWTVLAGDGGYTGGRAGPSHTLPITTGSEMSPSWNATMTDSPTPGMK